MSSKNKSGSFFYTLLGYIVILVMLLVTALIIGEGVYWFGVVPGVKPSADSIAKWVGLTVNTPAIFWWVIKESRPRWRNKVFWWTIASLLFVHVACFLVAFRFVQHWALWYFLVISTIEVPVILAVVDWTFEQFGRIDHSKPGGAQL